MPHLPLLLDSSCFREFLDSFDTVLSDCDGVIWTGDEMIERANEALNRLQELGKKVFYVTNNSTRTRDEYLEKLKQLGFKAKKEEIISSAYVTAQYLKEINFKKKVYVVGMQGMASELDNVGIAHNHVKTERAPNDISRLPRWLKLDPEVGAVAVGFDPNFSYPKIMRAASHLLDKDCLFIATGIDERVPVKNPDIVFPGAGSLVRAVQTAANRQPTVMGKPSEHMFKIITEKYKLDPSRTLMIGDRCNTDILFGNRCGLHTLVVLTGIAKLEDFEEYVNSDDEETYHLLAEYYLEGLSDIVDLLDEI